MSAKRKRKSESRQPNRTDSPEPSPAQPSVAQADMFQFACLLGTGALLVATPLLPGEAAADAGSGNVLASGWLVVTAGWLAMFALNPTTRMRTSPALIAVLGFAIWVVIDLAFKFGSIHARPAANVTLVYVGAAACIFSLVQLLQNERVRNGILALLIVLAAGLSAHGFYQYFVSSPKMASDYFELDESQKQRELMSLNLDPNPGSADRQHFEDRLESTEPTATFALGNSLAGFLAPVIVLIIASLFTEATGQRRWSLLAPLSVFLVACLICLMLTKSRTAYLATMAGVAALIFAAGAKIVDRRWLAMGGAAIIVIGALIMLGVLVGGIDIEVLSETLKSFSYRVEYWRATLSMIGDSPIFGCGPGQFQPAYTEYKLPQASETVADPHNFILEVAATTGIPGLLMLLAAVGFHVRTAMRSASAESDTAPVDGQSPESPTESALPRWSVVALAIGAVPGVILALGAGAMVDHIPNTWGLVFVMGALVLGFPLWWFGVELPKNAVVAALITWSINLLAAGGFSFPGVAIVGWALFSTLISQAATQSWEPRQGFRLALLMSVAAIVLVAMQYGTRPLQAGLALSNPLISNSFKDAKRIGDEAARNDPLWSEPWRHLAAIYHQRWVQSGNATDRTRYENAESKLLDLDPQSWIRRRQVADWRLNAWRMRGDKSDLEAAIEALRQAVERFPNSIELRAQLAWCYMLSGDQDGAVKEAKIAVSIDSQHPHKENKLANLKIFDPGPSPFVQGQPGPPSHTGAEPTMEQIRTAND